MIERKVIKSVKPAYIMIVAVILILLACVGPVNANTGALQQAEFIKEGVFRNCEVGQLRWKKGESDWAGSNRYVSVVLCGNIVSGSFQQGKVKTNYTVVQEQMSVAEYERQVKAEGLKKLTFEERRLLGLTK